MRTAAAVEGLVAYGALDAGAGRTALDVDAGISPLQGHELHQLETEVPAMAEVWRRGGVRMDFGAHMGRRREES